MARGTLAIVLHAHLPYVRHPEHQYHLEENWLYEAIAATYLPLLEVFRNLRRDHVDFRVTMSLSPPLIAMLRDDLLRTRAAAYLDRLLELGDVEIARNAGDPVFQRLASFYRDRFGRLKGLYDELGGDLVGAFARLEDEGFLELVTVAGTHGFLPNVRERAAARAQIEIAAEHHRKHIGRYPRGIWLPECGYTEGVDALLADAGIRFCFLDAHGLACGRPRPPLGTVAPVFTRAGVAAFARDLESSRSVWSAQEGYPGDPVYRDFYRDVGFDRPLAEILPFIHPDGIRLHTGYKYHRVTGKVDLGKKLPYDPDVARQRAWDHAGHFLQNRRGQVRWLAERMERPPIIVSPYDAELFGHWWFEGPAFLDGLCRQIGPADEVRLGTPAEYLETMEVNAVSEPSPSSWGDGGFASVWIDASNDWIYRHQHHAERRMIELAQKFSGGVSDLERRSLNQAARELLLLECSDWAFILKTGTAVGYAVNRVKAHAARFRRLDEALMSGVHDETWLADLEGRDNIFPDVDYRVYGRP